MTPTSTSPIVSVIVAAYQAEKYLERCLQSIAAQTLTDFEAIVVDDGSTDGTAAVARAFAEADPRFRLVVKERNEGQSAARQDALDRASGEYTIHVDSDDWVEPNMLEDLCALADEKSADMVIFDWIRTTETGDVYECQRPRSLEPRVILSQMLRPDLHASLCNKLIRRELYARFGVRFLPGMLMEDQYICLMMLAQPIRVEYINKAYYHYDTTQNLQSTVHKGIRPAARLRPLELLAQSTDISDIRESYDRAILYIAYEALFFSQEACPDYPALFRRHLASIRRAQGFPWRVKTLVLLRIRGIRVPIGAIKKFFHR